MAGSDNAKQLARKVVRALRQAYPDAKCSLDFSNPLELLVATILSAQCTDVRVNLVTKQLFRDFPSAAAYASAPADRLERAIQSTGFFRNKAKSIQACCTILTERYAGKVPPELDVLVELPGVGRKTANVVLGTAFGLASGVVVDTHVTRVCRRLGLTKEKDAVKIERDLMDVLPKKEWVDFSHRVIWHGRRVCDARKPKCPECPMRGFCPQIGVHNLQEG